MSKTVDIDEHRQKAELPCENADQIFSGHVK